MEKYEEDMTEENKKYEALVGNKSGEEEKLHEEIRELKRQQAEEKKQLHQDITRLGRQLVKGVNTEKESRPPESSESGYESTKSIITVITTKR